MSLNLHRNAMLRAGGAASLPRELVDRTALDDERRWCVLRAAFCAAVLVRFLAIREVRDPAALSSPGTALDLSVLGAGILFSAWAFRQIARGRATERLLATSIAVDASVGALSLLQTVLWPGPHDHYAGILLMPDIAVQHLIVMAAGLRLSPRLALFGGALNFAWAALLLSVDHARWGSQLGYGNVARTFHGLLLLAATAVAVLNAHRTRTLVQRAADASLKIERARSNLAFIARDHHDARNLLSAAVLHAEALEEDLQRALAHDPQKLEQARHVAGDLQSLSDQLEQLSHRAHGELVVLAEPEPVPAGRVLPETVALLRLRFPELAIEAELDDVPPARLVGGRASLQRVLYNLVDNARRGDGRRGAHRVRIGAVRARGRLRLDVEDDGPGFPGEAPGFSSKPEGLGLGLQLVAQVIAASGGTLALGRSDRLGGARVRLELPALG